MGSLKKSLGYKSILLITINSVMGTGVFFLPAVGAKAAGASSLFAWVLMGIVAIYTSMLFAELTSMYPKSGGIYEFAKQAYGRTISFFIGWMTLIAGYITIAMLVIGAIQYIFPPEYTFTVIIIAAFIVVLFNIVAYAGMQLSASMLVVFAFITVGTLVSLIVPGLFSMDFSLLDPMLLEGSLFLTAPLIFLAIFKIAETFFGWETATFLAGETKNGRVVVPKALVHSTIIITILVFIFVLTSLTTIPAQIFGQSLTPLTDLALIHYGPQALSVFAILVYLSIIGSVAGWIVSAPRLLLSLSEDGLFIKQFERISPRFSTPSYAIVFQTIVIIVFLIAGAGSYEVLLHLLVPLLLVLYSFVVLSVVILRYKMPHKSRPYKAPFAKTGPIVLILVYISLIVFWVHVEPDALRMTLLTLSFIGVGIPVYLLVRILNDSRFEAKVRDKFAYVNFLFEDLFIPKRVRNHLLSHLSNDSYKTILEYGTSTGILTEALLQKVGPSGRVISLNNSRTELHIVETRLRKKSFTDEQLKESLCALSLLHHELCADSVYEELPRIDAVLSIDMISSITKPKVLFSQLAELMPRGAPLVFFDFGNMFHFFPDQDWLSSDAQIISIMAECGFSVSVVRERGLLWKNLYIVGHRI